MKRLFLLFIFLLTGVAMFAQTITLSFTGRGKGGNVTEEIYQKIDSLQVRNINRHWEQMIYYPDTVVLLEALAVPMINVKQSGLEQNVPNPFDCVTEAILNLSQSENVTMQVLDASGKEYLTYNEKLPAGEHLFEITLAIPQTYFLTAITSTGKYMVKMVNLGSCGTNSISLKSSSDVEVRSKSLITNEFELGDQMEYFAYTTYNNLVFDGSLLQVQNCSEDITIHFNIPYCTYTMNVDYKYGCGSYTWINGVTYTETNHNAARMNLLSAGGCDSIVVLDVTIDHPFQTEENITACQPVTWNGINCTVTGEYIADLISQGGCDSTVTLNFTRVNDIRRMIVVEDCERYVWQHEDFEQILTETGVYEHTFRSQYGCDSIVSLHFTKTSDFIVETSIACDQFTWHENQRTFEFGTNYSLTSVHFNDTVYYTNRYGCDSIRVLDLTLFKVRENTINKTMCGEYIYHDETYTQSGVFHQTIPNFNGTCDSIVTLNLQIISATESDYYPVACESFFYNNQNYTVSGNYDVIFTVRPGCDSTVHMHLTVSHNTYADLYETVCDSYTWYGEEYTQSGNYEHRIYNTQGCDSIMTLHLTVNHSVTNPVVQVINECNMYELDGERIMETGDYTRTYRTVHGCDSIVNYHINIFTDVTHEFDQFACESFEWNGTTFEESGDYPKRLQTVHGCDSLVTMHLTIGHNTYREENVTACDSYTWRGNEYTVSGIYRDTIPNMQGCDSIMTLNLVVNHSVANEQYITECNFYMLDGERIETTGDYIRTYTAANGCDSVVTYHITINYDVTHEFNMYACGSYTWNGETYNQENDYVQHFQTVEGCDSTVTMHLFLGTPNYGITDVQVACDSYTWEGDTYTVSTTATKTLQNIYGCDSVVTLQLTINPTYSITVAHTDCDSYEWEGTNYTETGSYTKNLLSVSSCDSIVTLNLTINYSEATEFSDTSCGVYEWDGRMYSSTGDHQFTYQTSTGCDSVVTLHLVYHELVTDSRDGNTYCTMEYGDMVWTTENMRYLPQVNNDRNNEVAKYYVYGYKNANLNAAMQNANYQTYGTLYNWTAAQSACPTGWHLPDSTEWRHLINILQENGNAVGSQLAGEADLWSDGILKSSSQFGTSDFDALPGGYLNITSAAQNALQTTHFHDMGNEGNWWSATEGTSTSAYRYRIKYDSEDVDYTTMVRHRGYYVRCVKD